jgi:hypothetical protein
MEIKELKAIKEIKVIEELKDIVENRVQLVKSDVGVIKDIEDQLGIEGFLDGKEFKVHKVV